ncbi:MAG: hypothetical protein CM1200mP34_4200 [Verrucomicrobiales bacterium]|nr:MAG: hypothetical protein CM1200mP34_4200 [Verrucomicrobiales bacterium]
MALGWLPALSRLCTFSIPLDRRAGQSLGDSFALGCHRLGEARPSAPPRPVKAGVQKKKAPFPGPPENRPRLAKRYLSVLRNSSFVLNLAKGPA